MLFAAVVAALGGSSRPDAIQTVALRPLAGLFLIPAIYWIDREKLRDISTPILLLCALALWMALQLVPLPPALWQLLPGREPIAELGAALGASDVWRPISMVPARTLNALASLVVPIAALLLVAATGASKRTLFLLVIAIGSINAAVGLLQVISANSGPLYFYEITNFGSPVGLFANHNHAAVLSSLTLVLIAYCATVPEFSFHGSLPRIGFGILYVMILFAALIGASRAGLLTAALALATSLALLWLELRRSKRSRQKKIEKSSRVFSPAIILAIAVGALAAMVALFALAGSIPAFERLTAGGTFEDLRWGLLPTLREMAWTYGFLGSGFGSWEEVYHIHEPDTLMFASYVNMAHNDWAQLVIEGGLPALALVFALIAWVVRSIMVVVGGGEAGLGRLLLWLALGTIVLFASLADYPLRAPLFQLVAVWLVAVFAFERATYRDAA